MPDDTSLTGLVTRARHGDQQARDTLVERYAPLLWSICRAHRLAGPDAVGVSRSVWLLLAGQLELSADPAALADWLAATWPECARHQLLVAGRHAALREAFACLSPDCQRLIGMLIEEPPVPYATISARLGIPAGSIGPARRRCLQQLRRNPALAALISGSGSPSPGSGP
jgi:hypothetical protein